jgi:hypothetical protein
MTETARKYLKFSLSGLVLFLKFLAITSNKGILSETK